MIMKMYFYLGIEPELVQPYLRTQISHNCTSVNKYLHVFTDTGWKVIAPNNFRYFGSKCLKNAFSYFGTCQQYRIEREGRGDQGLQRTPPPPNNLQSDFIMKMQLFELSFMALQIGPPPEIDRKIVKTH